MLGEIGEGLLQTRTRGLFANLSFTVFSLHIFSEFYGANNFAGIPSPQFQDSVRLRKGVV